MLEISGYEPISLIHLSGSVDTDENRNQALSGVRDKLNNNEVFALHLEVVS